MTTRKLILLAITAIIFIVLFLQIDPAIAWNTLTAARVDILLLCAGISLLFPMLCALRWMWLMDALGAPIRFRDSLVIILAAWPLATVTPAKSGDLIKIVFLRNVLPYTKTGGIILAERILDVMVLSFSALLGGLWLGQLWIATLGGLLVAGMVSFLVLSASPLICLFPESIRTKVLDVLEASRQMYSSPKTFLLCTLVTVLNWFLSYFQTWLCFLALGGTVSLLFTIAALPIAIFAGLLPITLAGMGTRDSALIVLFQGITPYEINVAVGILYSIFGYWWLTLVGLPFFRIAMSGGIRNVSPEDIPR